MPKDARARTRAVRVRMAETGQSYTQATASLAAPPQMNRDLPPSEAVITLIFAEIMAVGRRAAIVASDDLAEAAAAVQAALTPMWPQVVPEAARDVLTTCAQIAVSRGVTELPPVVSNITAAAMLELTAGWVAAGSPGPGARSTPPAAYASSAAFDRFEDACGGQRAASRRANRHCAADSRPPISTKPAGWKIIGNVRSVVVIPVAPAEAMPQGAAIGTAHGTFS